MKAAGSFVLSQQASIAARVRDYWALSKPRVTLLVWATTAFGMGLAGGAPSWVWVAALVGSWFVIASANALNQILEVRADGKMSRTLARPLPDGRISIGEAVVVAVLWAASGLILLVYWVNLLTGAIGAISILLYAFAYTPLKSRTHLSTAVGAIPGAIPPLAGWTAATGTIGLPAVLLFAIQFFWQFPHFWSIAWLLREDYSKAGFKMLPFPGAEGRATGLCVVLYSLPLFPLAASFALFETQRVAYIVGAIALTSWFAFAGLRFWNDSSDLNARRVLRATVAYLPLLFVLMLVCR